MNDTTKKCPMCAEEIPLTAVTCEYCGAQFEVTSTGYCQNCHQVRDADANGQCKVCGNKVLDLRVESRLTEEPMQEPLPASQPIAQTEIAKTGKSCLPIGILVGILIFAVVGGLLWFGRSNLPAYSSLFATNTPTITPTFTPSPTATPRPTATATPLPDWVKEFWKPSIHMITDRSPDFQDDFSQRSTAWQFQTGPDMNKGKIEIGNDVLVMQVEPGEVGFSTNSKMRFDDFILRVNINLEQLGDMDAAAEIDWRGASDGGEVFSIWNNGRWQVAYCGSEDCELLISGQVSNLSSNLVTVTIISRGTEFAVFLNSTPLGYINDHGRRPGKDIKLSLWVNGNSPTMAVVKYDRLTLWNLSGVTSPTPAAPASAISLTPTQAANTAASDRGTMAGRILWGGQGMAGVTVKLCTHWEPYVAGLYRCTNTGPEIITDQDGRYVFSRLEAGEYYLLLELTDQPPLQYFDRKVNVVAGQIVTVDDIIVNKTDLELFTPVNRKVTTTTPTLDWVSYPGATYYEVYVSSLEMPEAVVNHEKVLVSQYVFKSPLASGQYYWSIYAFNAAGIMISNSLGLGLFVVEP